MSTEQQKQVVETIRHAVVKSIEGQMFLGKSHSDCFHQAMNLNIEMSKLACDQGFITNKGRFLDRKAAAKIAINSGQVKDDITILHSEDLWHLASGGKFEYDTIKGYYEAKVICGKTGF